MTSFDREPEKNAPYDAFEPSQVNGILRRRAQFLGMESVTAKTRTPTEPACFGSANGFASASGLFWLAVERTVRQVRVFAQKPP